MQPAALFSQPVDPNLDSPLPHIHTLLVVYYGRPKAREPWDPLTQFIYSLLSSRTRTPESQQVMRDLQTRFGDWESLRDASLGDIERTIQVVTFPEIKAPRLKAALVQITARCGSLSLDFLARYRTEKIRAWLESYEGVGPNTSAAVVNFSTLRRRALAVDANHLRVAQRLALTPRADAGVTEQRLMRLVPDSWDAEMLDEHHSLFKLHGQTLCIFSEPRCKACPLLSVCPSGKKRVSNS